MIPYLIAEAHKPDLLASKINELIELGYLPVGGVTSWKKGGGTGFIQAMLLSKDKKWWTPK